MCAGVSKLKIPFLKDHNAVLPAGDPGNGAVLFHAYRTALVQRDAILPVHALAGGQTADLEFCNVAACLRLIHLT